ncbi:NAD(P)/FAD-dependent oxidoreductase [Alkaliphilus crotonatoxidans]
MKVAIIGAGISGLACAFELKKHGITPVIFEKKSHIGEQICFSCATMHLFNRSIVDPLVLFKRKYGLVIKPTFHLKEIVMFSPRFKAVVKGNLGYIINRMKDKHALANQIYSQVQLPIEFNTLIHLEDIKNDFDHIVIATGDSNIAKQLNVWTDIFIAQFRSASVVGNFNTSAVSMWSNTEYAKNAFAYLIPNGPKEAAVKLIINGISQREIDHYWDLFLSTEKLNYHITEIRDAEHQCGFVWPYQLDNIYFIGNTGGFTDSLLGFGQLNAIESGLLAGQAIARNLDYNKLVKPIEADMLRLYEFRKALNTFDNNDLDKLILLLKTPGIKQLIYNNPVFKLKHSSFLAKIYNHIVKN